MTDRFTGEKHSAPPADGLALRAGSDETGRPVSGEAIEASCVTCPFCRSRETELVSLFGGQLSTDQYYCRACRSYFERFARDDERPDEY